MKPPIGRVGGKKSLKKRIIALFPEHTTYCEPFIGGGSVFYGKNPSEIEVINDLDEGIFNIHNGLKSYGNEIHEELERDIDKDKFNKYKASNPSCVKEKAKRDIIISKCSFMVNRQTYGNPNGLIRTNYRLYPERLQNTIIMNSDYKNVIKLYDSPSTLFYLDPPYENSIKTSFYNHDEFNLVDLESILKNIKGKFLLSMNDSDDVREIFKQYNIQPVSTIYKMSAISKREPRNRELFIMNYKIES